MNNGRAKFVIAWMLLGSVALNVFCSERKEYMSASSPEQVGASLVASRPSHPATASSLASIAAGSWISSDGMIVMQCEITAPREGEWFLYARKAARPEPFRWRFDDQPWRYVVRFGFRGIRQPSVFLKTDNDWIEAEDRISESVFLDAAPQPSGPPLGWTALGKVRLSSGRHVLRIEPEGDARPVFETFLLHEGSFTPRGALSPSDPLPREEGWWAFAPEPDRAAGLLVDLRTLLNEPFAGSKGFIATKGESFVHSETGEPVRFWGSHVQPCEMSPDLMEEQARFLARRGVNLVRIFPFHWRNSGPRALEPDPVKIRRFQRAVEIYKRQGIYVMVAIYSGRCFQDIGEVPGFECYRGSGKLPWLLHLFHPQFRAAYDQWLRSLMTAENPYTGVPLAKEPAILGVETQNEANTLWFVFQPKFHPPEVWAMVEARYEDWLKRKYGDMEAAWKAWGEKPSPEEKGRLMQDSYKLTNQSRRSADQVRFCTELERQFYEETRKFLKEDLGFGGLMLSSNWDTAQNDVLYPALAWAEDPQDFSDHHHYFPASSQKGEAAAESQPRFRNRSGLRWEGLKPDEHIICCGFLDVIRNGKPVMCSEYSWLGRNQWRPEYPLFVAAQSRSAGMDAPIEFQMAPIPGWSGSEVKWVRQHPAVLGQFPGAALLFRTNLLEEGRTLVRMRVNEDEARDLKAGQIVTKEGGRDFNRVFNGGAATTQEKNAVKNRGVYFSAGKVNLDVGPFPSKNEVADLGPYWDEAGKVIRHSNGQITWDYGHGVYLIDAPGANAAVGFLGAKKEITLSGLKLRTPLRFATVCLASLDGQPLPQARRMLLQVMSEQKQHGEQFSEPDAEGWMVVRQEGGSPYMVRDIAGEIEFRWKGAERCRVTPLQPNFSAAGPAVPGPRLELRRDVLYYLIEQ